jgi:hypothetical protein
MKQFTLSNGVTLELSTRKNNTSGYTNVTLSSAWTMDTTKPFIACTGQPSDPEIRVCMRAQERNCWQGGAYEDAREAAYVSALFKEDPIAIDAWIGDNGAWVDFPLDLYSLPVVIDKSTAVAMIKQKKTASVKKNPGNAVTEKKLPFRVVFPNRPVNDNKGIWEKIYNSYDGKNLFAKYGNDLVLRAKKYLTPQEFVNLFGL